MPPSPEPHAVGRHLLGPHVVGQRVVVRHVVRGESGPTGGPALNDVLGVCRAWGSGPDGLVVIDSERGPVEVRIADIVSGKPVPPRPSVRHRVAPRDAHVHSLAMWPDAERADLGDWVLRAAGRLPPDDSFPEGRLIARANSVLAMGDPGVPLEEAARAVTAFYTRRGLPVWAQVEVGGDVDRGLTALGWQASRPDEADTLFQVAGLPRVLRALSRRARSGGAPAHPDPEQPQLEVDGDRAVSRLGDRARARVAVDDAWVGLHDVWVAEEHRRTGLAGAVMLDALDWAASRGASTVYLQVRADNLRALRLYEGLGFVTHHTYRYLVAG